MNSASPEIPMTMGNFLKGNIRIFVPFLTAVLTGLLILILVHLVIDNSIRQRAEEAKEANSPVTISPTGILSAETLRQLSLSHAQKEQWRLIEDKAHGDLAGFQSCVRTIDEQLEIITKSENADEAQMRTLVKNKAQTMTEIEIIDRRKDIAIRRLLTEAQKSRFKQLIK